MGVSFTSLVCGCGCHKRYTDGFPSGCEDCSVAHQQTALTPVPLEPNTGRKDDAGKARFDLIPPAVLLEVAKVFTYGAARYGDANYRLVVGGRWRYVAAFHRHVNAMQRGEERDAESGLLHLAHAITCLMILGDLPPTDTEKE